MGWLILTILSVLSRAVYGVFTKVFSNDLSVSSATQTVVLSGLSAVIVLPLSIFIGGISTKGFSGNWPTIFIMILSVSLGNILYFKGIERLDSGTTQIAFSSILIWGAILSVLFLHSHFSLLQGVGIILLLFAIIFSQYKKGKIKLSPSIGYIVASAASFAVFQVTSAELATKMTAGTYLLLAYLGCVFIVGAIYFGKISQEMGVLIKDIAKVGKATFLASSTSLMYFVFSYFAYRVAPDRGVVVVLLSTQVIFAVILGGIFLKEREGLGRKVFAGVLAVIAGIFIKA